MRKNFRTNAGDVASNFLHCGDSVRSVLDSRHTGKVLSIHWGTAKVRWDDYGWISEELVADLIKEPTALDRYWAESATESLLENYRTGNFKTIKAGS